MPWADWSKEVCSAGLERSGDNLPALLSKGERLFHPEAAGEASPSVEMQEGRGSLLILQESSPLWFPYLHDLKCSFLKHHEKGAASLARPRLGTWDTANVSSLPRLCLTKGTEVVTPRASLSN